MIEEFKVPVIVEIILERVTNISMGTEINAVNEFEDLALVGDFRGSGRDQVMTNPTIRRRWPSP